MKTTIPQKANNIGRIARLNELFRDLFHLSDAERTSFRERSKINPTTAVAPYCGSPGLVSMDMALEDIALEDIALETALDEIILNNMKYTPP